MAACKRCVAVGLEICPRRNDVALNILSAFDSVCLSLGLEKWCIGSLVKFHCKDFKDCTDLLESASLIYVNNFGTHFDNYNHIIHGKLNSLKREAQIICTNSLTAVRNEVRQRIKDYDYSFFQSREGEFSWSNLSVRIHLYTRK